MQPLEQVSFPQTRKLLRRVMTLPYRYLSRRARRFMSLNTPLKAAWEHRSGGLAPHDGGNTPWRPAPIFQPRTQR